MNARAFALLAAGAVTLGACSNDSEPFAPPADAVVQTPAEPARDAIARIAIDAGFTELVSALQYVDAELNAGLVALFLANNSGPFTVFAPSDAAFEGLYAILTPILGVPVDEITDLPASVVLQVLQYHVVEGRRPAATVVPRVGNRELTTLLGESFAVTPNGQIRDGLADSPRGAANIVTADVRATNGVVHVIDQVIVPPSVVAALTGN